EHIQSLVGAVGHGTRPRARASWSGAKSAPNGARPSRWSVSSGMTAMALEQDPRPLLIGERLNTQGSRKMKRLALEGSLEDMVPMAREQVEGGAHVLDLCLALTERTDEAEQMRALVKRLSLSVEAPLCIDSTEAHVIDEALQACPGSAIVNSINLENGRARIEAVMPLVVRYGAAVIALTIDETGMAKTAERKLEVARRIRDIVCGEDGLPAGRPVFHGPTVTPGTGGPGVTPPG